MHHQIQITNGTLHFDYTITSASTFQVSYVVQLANGHKANETPIQFHAKREGKQWILGTYQGESFKPEQDFISVTIADAIISTDTSFTAEDKVRRWQSFSLEGSQGKYRYSDHIDGFEVVYTYNIGFLKMNPEDLEEDKFIITQVADKWQTSRILADNGREIIKTVLTDEIMNFILNNNIY